ncbi:T3SS effector protein NleH, partial [Escherichia coli]|nr:T3SS effector protein NleH [Escherichia coli]
DRERNEFYPIDISSYNFSDFSSGDEQVARSYHEGKKELIDEVLSKIE